MKCSRRIRQLSPRSASRPPPASLQSRQRNRPTCRGSILDADPRLRGQYCRPNDIIPSATIRSRTTSTTMSHARRTVPRCAMWSIPGSWPAPTGHVRWRSLPTRTTSDVTDSHMEPLAEGIHLGAMAGTVDQVLRCRRVSRSRATSLLFNPELPPEIASLDAHLRYRGHSLALRLTHDA